ncbi:uncharacterized protein LOC123663886 [Melitaea cinxia]|uniref:uncharacterized protein LOC123663886 n=1 Tax=Melitaea cinxia TaxID=113334 RepID=UPI001E273AFB|nr:uncharacterized protein LOC123663886 [Melitaea cinxia]XP_045454490.1 uncharacterized protein LOC123663886 [Melitaea cinxia]
MSNKNVYQKLGHKVSEEVQLLAEEKWIVDTLTKIKNQRNCLQIERLHLESLKAKLKGNTKKDAQETVTKLNEDGIATTSAVNLMQHVTTTKSAGEIVEKDLTIDDVFCNDQELNLMVTQPSFVQNSNNLDFNMEEDEEESDDDMLIDINMFMNGIPEKETKYKVGK